jgi:hypothetical protein
VRAIPRGTLCVNEEVHACDISAGANGTDGEILAPAFLSSRRVVREFNVFRGPPPIESTSIGVECSVRLSYVLLFEWQPMRFIVGAAVIEFIFLWVLSFYILYYISRSECYFCFGALE